MWKKLSHYKTRNKMLDAEATRTANAYYVNFKKWNNLFEPNICNTFLNFIMENKLYLEFFCYEDSGIKRIYVDEFIRFINDINFII